ncbi:hypothetical protein JD844_006238 [Phrynosoma platyrhinos]|uniref:G-protein coupled receptors family 1 profile domain-containing protein n=1 Tax=Phrynosoma platyrhinos TaxID=52577 RepID=A0ABQ7T172_PHRPL|nr:hypothetical protein JD844_006238 [Phrynosoma platyrhinos]
MNTQSFRRGISCLSTDFNCSQILDALNDSEVNAYRLVDMAPLAPTVSMAQKLLEQTMLNLPDPFPTADVPAHAHYTIGAVILVVGITGTLVERPISQGPIHMLLLQLSSDCFKKGEGGDVGKKKLAGLPLPATWSRGLRTPTNMFIINLAVSDFLMSITQCPIFFTNSLNKRWIFGAKGCELYAFCGALFGIASMITLTVIALDRYFVITRPLASIGVMSKKKALLILLGIWLYSLAWSLPPFFGWSAYVPEGLLTSCSWDYITFTPSVRAYTMLLFCFVFFIPLIAIIYSYVFIFRAIKNANRAVQRINSDSSKESQKLYQRMKNEWKMAKVALIVILLFVISWSPYSVVALVAFAGYSHLLTPYMNSVPAVIAKASAIHNPIIYAIAHPKYR